ncbi:hypothetical protein [Streptomyces sp. NPDC057877]|uniref:hypothetical protein n=1 Tax=Streptomyces sp. NPDC057877 TaxID=3346269 RepID=UPI0036B2454A
MGVFNIRVGAATCPVARQPPCPAAEQRRYARDQGHAAEEGVEARYADMDWRQSD